MTLDQIRAALKKLAKRRAVETLLELNQVRREPALAADPNYQRKFIGYYRMGRKSAEFYRHFFSMLEAAASASSLPSLAAILQDLFDRTKQRHLSFGSKMRATVTDDAVIFDRNVATHFHVPSSPLRQSKDWLAKALQRHDRVAQGIQAFVQRPDWPEIRALFDQAFPNAKHLPDIRKADLIIWAAYDPRGATTIYRGSKLATE